MVLLVGTDDGCVRKYDEESGASLGAVIRDVATGAPQPWALSGPRAAGESLVALGGGDAAGASSVAALSTATGRADRRWHGMDRLTAVAAHGARLWAAGGAAGRLAVWDTASGSLLGAAEDAHMQGVAALAFSGDGSCVVSAGCDGRLRLWDAETLALVLDVDAAGTPLLGLHVGFGVGRAFRVYTLASSGDVAAWDAVDGARLFLVRVPGALSLAVSASESALFVGCTDGCVRAIAISGSALSDAGAVLRGDGPVVSLALSADGRTLAAAHASAPAGGVALWLLGGGTRASLVRRIALPDGTGVGRGLSFVPRDALLEARLVLGQPGRVPAALSACQSYQLPSGGLEYGGAPSAAPLAAPPAPREPEDIAALKRGYARLLDHVFSAAVQQQ